MENVIKFLIEAGKLKKIKRTGWVLRGVKNPETIADHTFRMTLMAWLLGGGRNLNLSKVIQIALIHDLCEVYVGDITPYDAVLSTSQESRKAILRKMPRLPQAIRDKRTKEKHKKEKKSLQRITSFLPKKDQEEIMTLWLDYENGTTKEGRFVKQVDRVENLLQAVEYWKQNKDFPIEPWWIQLKELVDDPNLLKFIATLDRQFQKEYNSASRYGHSRIRSDKNK